MFWQKKESPKIVEKIVVYPTDEDMSPEGYPVLPSQNNFQRYSALMYAGVAAISLAAMIALIGLKPMAYLVLKGRDPLAPVPEISSLVTDCYISYDACYDFPQFQEKQTPEYEAQLNQIAKENDLNPILLTALSQSTSKDSIPSLEIMNQVATTFKMNRQNHQGDTIPTVISTDFGNYKLNKVNQITYVSILTLQSLLRTREAFSATVVPSPNDGQVNCLNELIEAIL